jgi:hypothetical protein
MKTRSQVAGTTFYPNKRKRINRSIEEENVTQRRRRKSGGVQLSRTTTRIRKVTKKTHRSPVIRANFENIDQQHEMTVQENRSPSQGGKESARDLPAEEVLKIIQNHKDKELCLSDAPASEEWSKSSKRFYFWKELQFSNHTISTEELCDIIERSPYLRKLTLRGRQDTDAILHAVLASSHDIQTLEILDCKGSEIQDRVSGDILSRIIRKHAKLRKIMLDDTIITESNFYEVLQQYIDELDEVLITITTQEDGRSFLDACTQYYVPVQTSHKDEHKDFKDLIQVLPKKG